MAAEGQSPPPFGGIAFSDQEGDTTQTHTHAHTHTLCQGNEAMKRCFSFLDESSDVVDDDDPPPFSPLIRLSGPVRRPLATPADSVTAPGGGGGNGRGEVFEIQVRGGGGVEGKSFECHPRIAIN